MNFTQKWGGIRAFKTEVEVDLLNTGINFTFSDRKWSKQSMKESHFIPYEELDHSVMRGTRMHSAHPLAQEGSLGGVGGNIVIAVTPLSFFAALPFVKIFRVLYGMGGKQKVIVIGSGSKGFLTIIDDEQADRIIDAIFKARNDYLRAKYIDVPNPKPEDIDRMIVLGVIKRGN